MIKKLIALASYTAILLCICNLASAGDSLFPERIPLLTRSDFFLRQPSTDSFRFNADGKKLAYLARNTKKLMLTNADCPACENQLAPIDLPAGVRPFLFFWTKNPLKMLIVYSAPEKKRMDVAVYDVAEKKFTSLFPEANVSLPFVDASPKYFYAIPTAIFQVNENESRFYKVDFERGERVEVSKKGDLLEVDNIAGGVIAIDRKSRPDMAQWYFTKNNGERLPLASFNDYDQRVNSGFLTSYLDRNNIGHALFMASSTTDTVVLSAFNLSTGKKTIVAQDKADIQQVLIKPHGPVQAFISNYLKPEWVVLDRTLGPDMQFLQRQLKQVRRIEGRSANDQRWVVIERDAIGQEIPFMFDRRTRKLTQIVVPGRQPLAFDPGYRVRAEVITARDNTPLVTYLVTPPGRLCARNDCPLVVLPHGGPFDRDEYPGNATNAWLANRGYAVLTVNFRGSSGFGKAFRNLIIGQWGLATQNDVTDAVDWAIHTAKVADPKRIAIVGASFGGDAALNGITFSPERFACAVVAGAGPNLASFVEKVSASAPELAEHLYENVGDVRKPEVKAALEARSPWANMAAVKAPVLIAHGANDKSAPFEDMVAYAEALRAKGAKVAFVVYPEEGHGFANPQTRATHYGVIENFLAGCLGGRAEPVDLSTARQKVDIRFGEQEFTFLKNSRVGN